MCLGQSAEESEENRTSLMSDGLLNVFSATNWDVEGTFTFCFFVFVCSLRVMRGSVHYIGCFGLNVASLV